MSNVAKRTLSYAEYAAGEETSPVKHQFFNGEVFAMSGGTPEHGALAQVVSGMLQRQLGERCRSFSSDVKVRTPSGLGTYPDISVVCGSVVRDDEDPNSIKNPILLVEVLSPSTKDYDRGEKFDHYRTIPTLKECLFISFEEPLVELRTRNENGTWQVSFATAGESITLRSVDAHIDVDALYRGMVRDEGERRMRLG